MTFILDTPPRSFTIFLVALFDNDICETNWDYWAALNGVNH